MVSKQTNKQHMESKITTYQTNKQQMKNKLTTYQTNKQQLEKTYYISKNKQANKLAYTYEAHIKKK